MQQAKPFPMLKTSEVFETLYLREERTPVIANGWHNGKKCQQKGPGKGKKQMLCSIRSFIFLLNYKSPNEIKNENQAQCTSLPET